MSFSAKSRPCNERIAESARACERGERPRRTNSPVRLDRPAHPLQGAGPERVEVLHVAAQVAQISLDAVLRQVLLDSDVRDEQIEEGAGSSGDMARR